MSRSLAVVLISAAAGLAVGLACAGAGTNKKGIKEACTRNLDCAYGLECVDATGAPVASAGEDAGSRKDRTCQWKSFGDCDAPESADGGVTPASAQGGQQCLAGYKCRDGKCTVMCVGNKDCRSGETCKIGICQRQSGGQLAQCFDNRDCPWPETCYYGQCVTRTEGVRCQSDLDCHSGFRCINGICQ